MRQKWKVGTAQKQKEHRGQGLNKHILELEAENAKLKEIIKSALDIRALWEPCEGWESLDESQALYEMAKRFEKALGE